MLPANDCDVRLPLLDVSDARADRAQVRDSCGGQSEVLTARLNVTSTLTSAGRSRRLMAADFWAKAQAKVRPWLPPCPS